HVTGVQTCALPISFPTALEVAAEWHLRMQAAVQRHVDAAVSKTVNLPADATVEDVREIYLAAWRARVKGITVYRYGSKPDQVLTLLGDGGGALGPSVHADVAFAGGCAGHVCAFCARSATGDRAAFPAPPA